MRFTHGYISAGPRDLSEAERKMLRSRGSKLQLDAIVYVVFLFVALACFALGAYVIPVNLIGACVLMVMGFAALIYLPRQIRSHYVLAAGLMRAARSGKVEQFERGPDEYLAHVMATENLSPHWEDIADRIRSESGRNVRKFDIVPERRQIVLLEGHLARIASFVEIFESKTEVNKTPDKAG